MHESGTGGTKSIYTEQDSAGGNHAFGERVFGDSVALQIEQTTLPKPEREQTTAWGFREFARRGWGRPEYYEPYIIYPLGNEGIEITFYGEHWATLGRLRNDTQRSIISEVPKFRLGELGCYDLEFALSELPGFPLIQNSLVGVKIGRSRYDIYRGRLREDPQPGRTDRTRYVFRVNGLRAALKGLTVNSAISVPVPRDVGDVAKEIFINEARDETAIIYDPSVIDTETGTLIPNDLDFKTNSLIDVFQMLADMAGCDWGVNGVGKFYFLPFSRVVQSVHVVGMGKLKSFEPVEDIEGVVNILDILREKPEGSGETGYTYGYQTSDAESRAKYGDRPYPNGYKVPGFFSDATCKIIGDVVLQDLKDPKYSATAEFVYNNASDILTDGLHRFIGPLENRRSTLTECESSDEWTSTEGVAISVSSSIYLSGNSSIRLDYDSAGVAVYTPPVAPENIVKIMIWFKSPRIGQYLRVGYGAVNWDDGDPVEFAINSANTWVPFEWDTSSYSNRTIVKIGFELLADSGFSNSKISIDRIQLVARGREHYTLKLKHQDIDTAKGTIKAEFGPGVAKFDDYFKNIVALAESDRLALTEQ